MKVLMTLMIFLSLSAFAEAPDCQVKFRISGASKARVEEKAAQVIPLATSEGGVLVAHVEGTDSIDFMTEEQLNKPNMKTYAPFERRRMEPYLASQDVTWQRDSYRQEATFPELRLTFSAETDAVARAIAVAVQAVYRDLNPNFGGLWMTVSPSCKSQPPVIRYF